MEPFNSLDFEYDDMSKHHWNVKEYADDLKSKILGSLYLLSFLIAISTISCEDCDDSDKHGDEPKWNIDTSSVEQWYKIDVYKSGR